MEYQLSCNTEHPVAMMVKLHFGLPIFPESYLEDGTHSWDEYNQIWNFHLFWDNRTEEEKQLERNENIKELLYGYVRITHTKIAQREEEQRIIDEENLPVLN